MKQKKILIVSNSFYPMNSPRSFRTTELVKEFSRQGHKVTLLTVKNDKFHRSFEKEYGVKIKNLGERKLPGIDIDSSSGVSRFLKRVLSRGLYQLFEYPKIELMFKVKKALENESGYDLLISIAVPHPNHWGVAWAWRDSNPIAETWIADCGDPYMGATLDTFNKMFYFKYLEKAFCRRADFITVPFEGAKNAYYPEFHDKIKVIPQGFNFNEVEIEQQAYSPNPVPTFAYAGGFIPGGRDPREFLDYIVSLEMDFKFILFTKNTGLIEPYMDRAGGRIEINDYIPRKKLLPILSKMDFLINFQNESTTALPSKLIDYYLTGRPILPVRSFDINKRKIDQFLNRNYEEQYKYENIDQYRIENVCKRFLELCDLSKNV